MRESKFQVIMVASRAEAYAVSGAETYFLIFTNIQIKIYQPDSNFKQ